jgi:putative membrane protein
MVRVVLSVLAQLLANAIALLVANAVLDDFDLNASAFLLAVVIFTVAEMLLLPFFRQMALQKAQTLAGSTALVSSLGALIVTAVLSEGLEIEGIGTWAVATLIVWAASLVTTLLLPVFVFKRLRDDRRPR